MAKERDLGMVEKKLLKKRFGAFLTLREVPEGSKVVFPDLIKDSKAEIWITHGLVAYNEFEVYKETDHDEVKSFHPDELIVLIS